ncbi:Antolefinin, putative [Pediculus humanus corporis]|uniref:Antolefinin, putative n=1 Tax=Pediculus humanus subsp. corporis TaxID=121224 RepID=E0VUC6_PEDHC|nr:Antolefinin, putative [Pediculus humanus corporis]EEB16982.1 Antolefinin, putative [Pediculus humanus corporis]
MPKRKKHKLGGIKETPFQHTFVMKLFDRSVDLAQFEENTPLYPICRAWMANNPRSFVNSRLNKDSCKKIKKEDKREISKKFKLEDLLLKEVYGLPAPLPSDNSTVPLPTFPKKEFELPSENEKNQPTKEVLLANHITHWTEVKKKKKAEAFKREQRYAPSKKLLRRIFHGAQ